MESRNIPQGGTEGLPPELGAEPTLRDSITKAHEALARASEGHGYEAETAAAKRAVSDKPELMERHGAFLLRQQEAAARSRERVTAFYRDIPKSRAVTSAREAATRAMPAEEKPASAEERQEMRERLEMEKQATAYVKSNRFREVLRSALGLVENDPRLRKDEIAKGMADYLTSEGRVRPPRLLETMCERRNPGNGKNQLEEVLDQIKRDFFSFKERTERGPAAA